MTAPEDVASSLGSVGRVGRGAVAALDDDFSS